MLHSNIKWSDLPLVAFDTETSGGYPVESQIIELGAVKWKNGQIIDRFQTFIKSNKLLEPENIKIHGITNEMIAHAPEMSSQILPFCDFIDGTILMAHHAPFDLGFLAPEIEKQGLQYPKNFLFCTSLLSRALIATTNHKLQTLVKELNLTGGDAHRAFDDAYACLQVFLKCIEKLNPDVTIKELQSIQKKSLNWPNYSLLNNSPEAIQFFYKAILEHQTIQIIYEGGQSKNKPRAIRPLGLVRNPDGDYIRALCMLDHQIKRFYISKILKYD